MNKKFGNNLSTLTRTVRRIDCGIRFFEVNLQGELRLIRFHIIHIYAKETKLLPFAVLYTNILFRFI